MKDKDDDREDPEFLEEKVREATKSPHQDNMLPAGFVTSEYFALIHKSIDLKKARQIRKASNAIDNEFRKLDKRGFVDWSSVRLMRDVKQESKDSGKPAHFGNLMQLCHERHAALKMEERLKEYKARLVFR